jgi:hypothetical protein
MGQGLIAVTDPARRLVSHGSTAGDVVNASTVFAAPNRRGRITAPLATSFFHARRAAL